MSNRRDFITSAMAAAGIPAVSSLQSYEPKKDEVLIFQFDEILSDAACHRIKQVIQENLPGQKCLVIGARCNISVAKVPSE